MLFYNTVDCITRIIESRMQVEVEQVLGSKIRNMAYFQVYLWYILSEG